MKGFKTERLVCDQASCSEDPETGDIVVRILSSPVRRELLLVFEAANLPELQLALDRYLMARPNESPTN
jgi:hypothetical protein